MPRRSRLKSLFGVFLATGVVGGLLVRSPGGFALEANCGSIFALKSPQASAELIATIDELVSFQREIEGMPADISRTQAVLTFQRKLRDLAQIVGPELKALFEIRKSEMKEKKKVEDELEALRKRQAQQMLKLTRFKKLTSLADSAHRRNQPFFEDGLLPVVVDGRLRVLDTAKDSFVSHAIIDALSLRGLASVGLALSPKKDRLIVLSAIDKRALSVDLKTGAVATLFEGVDIHTAAMSRFSKDGEFLFIATTSGDTRVFSFSKMQPLFEGTGSGGFIAGINESPDVHWVLFSRNGGLDLVDLRTGIKKELPKSDHTGPLAFKDGTFSRDSASLILGTGARAMQLDLSSNQLKDLPIPVKDGITRIYSDGKVLALPAALWRPADQPPVRIYDLATGMERTPDFSSLGIRQAMNFELSADGETLFFEESDMDASREKKPRTPRLFGINLNTMEVRAYALPADAPQWHYCSIAPDGSMVLSWGDDGATYLIY